MLAPVCWCATFSSATLAVQQRTAHMNAVGVGLVSVGCIHKCNVYVCTDESQVANRYGFMLYGTRKLFFTGEGAKLS